MTGTERNLGYRNKDNLLVSWCFEPGHPQRMMSRLKTNFILCPSYSFRKTFIPQVSFSLTTTQIISTTSECKSRKTIIQVLELIYIPRAVNTGNLHQLSVTMSRMTYFILRASTGTAVNHSQQRRSSGEIFEKMQVNRPKVVAISKEEIPGSKKSMYGYILTYSRL